MKTKSCTNCEKLKVENQELKKWINHLDKWFSQSLELFKGSKPINRGRPCGT